MDRFTEFLRRQVDIDLELLRRAREDEESGTKQCTSPHCTTAVHRGFRECELKTRLLHDHQRCGTGHGPCDRLDEAYPPEDERGCPTRAALGLPYTDRPGYRARWRP